MVAVMIHSSMLVLSCSMQSNPVQLSSPQAAAAAYSSKAEL